MRISTKMVCDKIVYDLNRLAEDMKKVNETISSGERLNRPSDDPLGLVGALGLKSTLSEIHQYRRNIDFGSGWLATAETTIQGSMDIVMRAKELAVQMSNATYTQDQRKSAATEVDAILKELMRIANTQYQGRYVFAGYKTDTVPYVLDEDETAASYCGDSNNLEIKTGKNSRMAIGQYGSQVFGEEKDTGYAFSVLIRLRDALEKNDVPGIQDELTNLGTVYQRMTAATGEIGARMNTLEIKKNILSDLESISTERLSDLEDTDIVKAITDLTTKQTAYQAALVAAAKVTQLNLADYI